MAEVNCDIFGFFDGVYDIMQTNWSNYWKGVITDGVVADRGNELEVYGNSTGMVVYVKTGEGMVDNHKGTVSVQKSLSVPTADTSYDRIDSVVLRAVYGNSGESYIALDVLEGTPAVTPQPPDLTQITGDVYEIRLANIMVAVNAVTIMQTDVYDQRDMITIKEVLGSEYWRNKAFGW